MNSSGAPEQVRIGVVGVGKMGLSHMSILGALPGVQLAAICDASSYVLGVLRKYTGVQTYTDYAEMLDRAELDAVVIATPSRTHDQMVRSALDKGLHVFCEKPFTLEPQVSRELAEAAGERGLVTQVGYHNRFVGAFREVKSLIDAGAIGRITHVTGEAYGPVVLRPKGGTWRSRSAEGGGSLYDYAAHPLDLLTWYLGAPTGVGGAVLGKTFSRETDDEVYATLFYDGGCTARISVNWADESERKMTTQITAWGTTGRITADRQECRVYLRDTAVIPEGYEVGWNVRYTTELTEPVAFYLRGEEYSAQLEHFVARIAAGNTDGLNDFASAAITDEVIALLVSDATKGPSTLRGEHAPAAPAPRRTFLRGRRTARMAQPVPVASREGQL